MGTTRNGKVLWNADSTAETRSYDFDTAYNPTTQRILSGTLTAGDSLIVSVTLTVDGVTTTVAEQTLTSTSFNYTINGPVMTITLQKVGTTGPATVVVYG